MLSIKNFLVVSLVAGLTAYHSSAQAFDNIIQTPDHGTCIYSGQTATHLKYFCQDEVTIYVRKAPGGGNNGGGGNGPGWGNE